MSAHEPAMTRWALALRSLRHYWRVNLAVALGVGVAVSSLAGALIVGDSVRASLRELALVRLGRAEHVITASSLFTSQLAERLASSPAFRAGWQGAAPVLALEGVVTHERSGNRAGGVQVYGVDDRFWTFHAVDGVSGPGGREAFLSEALGRELGAAAGDALLLRVDKPSAIPAGVLQGRRDEPGRAIRLAAARVLDRAHLGDFSPRPQQGATRAIFVPLDRLQRDLELPHRVNMLLAARGTAGARTEELQALVETQADLADLGVRMRPLGDRSLALESETGLLAEDVERAGRDAAREIGIEPVPVLTYLATAIKVENRETPYSLVTALPQEVIAGGGRSAVGGEEPGARRSALGDGNLGRRAWAVGGGELGVRLSALHDENSGRRVSAVGREEPGARRSALGDGNLGRRSSANAGEPDRRALIADSRAQTADGPPPTAHSRPPVWLTQWTADDLGAQVGDLVTLEYYLWSDDQGLSTGGWEFAVAGVLPMTGLAVDADLTPEYPGMSTSADMDDWDPPFPVDLTRIRPRDEDYWDEYRTAPKAFIRIEDGQMLWRSRYGNVSSLRIPAGARAMADLHAAYRDALSKHLSPRSAGFRTIPVRENALAAAAGTTDFGEYFTYFSFFLVVSSLLLTLLFFRLGIEQRAREVGVLAAMGYTPRAIRAQLLAEGAVLAGAGAMLGAAGAVAYASLIMLGLRTWWVDAVGTSDLTLHVSPGTLASGAAIGIVAGLVFIAWSLRVLQRASARELMSGAWVDADTRSEARPWAVGRRQWSRASTADARRPTDERTRITADGRRPTAEATPTGESLPAPRARLRVPRDLRAWTLITAAAALLLVAAGFAGWLAPAAAFFGSGTLLLVAGLCALGAWLRATSRRTFIHSRWPVAALGLGTARYRPSRSVLSATLIAAATFLIVSVGAFRRGAEDIGDAKSASGGYALIAETMAPLMHDPATPEGREALNLGPELEGIHVARFRLRPGDDASCLNLYRPQSPRLLGATTPFMRAGRFTFASSMAETPDEHANPWLLLNRRFPDGAVPVIGDATSLAYVFHLSVGDDYVMQGPDGRPLALRIVGALRDSVLQSELIMSDAQFTRLFPRHDGFRVFLLEVEPSRAAAVTTALEEQLQDFGMDVQSTAERLASYHRVENTFLTTFQTLGALGLVLGTLGLGTVLLRNVLERRRELALLQAAGYRRRHLVRMVLAESVFLLACGLLLGVVSAAVAIAPAYLERAQPFPLLATMGLLGAVLAAGLLSTIMATRAVARLPLLESLKNE